MKLDAKKLNPYVSLKGETLSAHFDFMDSMLWHCLFIVGQTEPDYLQKTAMEPIIRQVSGTSHGRRWFIRGKNEKYNGQLVDAIRRWTQTSDWAMFMEHLQWLQLYRDTLRRWIEDYESDDPRVQEHLDQWMRNYYKIRGEITESYLPLVWSIASSYGFTEDSKADMFQIGTTGLVHATERYHNVGPMTFPSFAGRWIRQRILMAISRQLSMIRVSHSVLEAQSRINRAERKSGKSDTSEYASRIRTMSAAKDVVLMEDMGNVTPEERQEDSRIDLATIPRKVRKVLLIKHDVLDRAKNKHTKEEQARERARQIDAYITWCKDQPTSD